MADGGVDFPCFLLDEERGRLCAGQVRDGCFEQDIARLGPRVCAGVESRPWGCPRIGRSVRLARSGGSDTAFVHRSFHRGERPTAGRIARLRCVRAADKRIEARLDDLRARGIYSDVCPILKTLEEASRVRPLYLDFVEDAILLCDRGGFFAGVLRHLKRRLKELVSVRPQKGRIRYWELKPDYRPGEIFDL